MSDTVRISSDGMFYTLQGEGPLVGMPSIFVRFDTCNLRCAWGSTLCDASYTSWTPGDRRILISEMTTTLLAMVRRYNCRHIVITGGEPMLQVPAVQAITEIVKGIGGHTTIETNGTRYAEETGLDRICISPKLSTSVPVGTQYAKMHEKARWNPNSIARWLDEYGLAVYFKFVIDSEEDIDEALSMLRDVKVDPNPRQVVFMPQGITTAELWERGRWVAERCKTLGVRFTPRLQVDLWGNTPGT